jgi:hypothetical protein
MSHRRIASALCMLIALGHGACSQNDGAQAGGETHWLTLCDVDADCGDELSCVCGSQPPRKFNTETAGSTGHESHLTAQSKKLFQMRLPHCISPFIATASGERPQNASPGANASS